MLFIKERTGFMKKILLITLVILMLTSVTSFADSGLYNETIKTDLQNLGIMTGDQNGNLHLEDNITRAETAKLICAAGKLNTEFTDEAAIFPDVANNHWGYKYIRAVFEAGIAIGDERGYFNPESSVTNEEFIKMVVSLLGFEPLAEQRGGYPAGYNVVASTYGLTEGFQFEVNAPAVRQDMAVIIWRALDTPVMMEKIQKESSISYCVMNGEKGIPLVTLRNGTSKWDTSKENIPKYLYEFAALYPYKDGDTEKSFTLYPDIVYTSGLEKDFDGTEYEAPAMYFDEMAQNIISVMKNGTVNIEFDKENFESDYITFDSKYLVPVETLSKLGLKTQINPALYLATIKNDDTILEIQPNVIGMRKNQAEGYWVPLEVCARIYNNTFYVPLEAVIREFGLSAEINGDVIIIE